MRRLVQLLGVILILQGIGAIADHLLLRRGGEVFLVTHLPFLAGYRVFASLVLAALGVFLVVVPAEAGPRPETSAAPEEGRPVAGQRAMPRRLAPAVGLFFLAPLVGEYLLGNVPASQLAGLLVLAPMYGGGALLVREVARRAGLGWPGIILLAGAYGVIEPGLFDLSLFNPSFEDLDVRDDPTYLPAIGISATDALTYTVGHVVWSIGVPIAVVETLVPRRRTTPWLGWVGLAVAGVAYLLGGALILSDARETQRVVPSAAQTAAVAAVAVTLIGVAFAVRGRHRTEADRSGADRRAPSTRLVGTAAFVASGAFAARSEGWPAVALGVALIAAMTVLVTRWSRRAGWGDTHRLALAGGALLTYVWLGFVLTTLLGHTGLVDLIGQTALALGAVALLAVAARTVRRTRSPA